MLASPNTEQETLDSAPKLRLRNVIKQQNNVQQQLGKFPSRCSSKKVEQMRKTLLSYTAEIERICQQHQVTPAALSPPSRKAYAWMKFLTEPHNLMLHLEALQKIKRLCQNALKERRLKNKDVIVEIINCTSLYKYRNSSKNNIELKISEGFIQADDTVLQAAVNVVLLENNSQDNQIIRDFGLSEEYQNVILELDLIADIEAETPQGDCYNLEHLFEEINQDYFAGKMVKPRLDWNRTLTHRKLGHYEPARDRVVMSRTLDDACVPQTVVEFILYHELLHKYHGVKRVNGKFMVHTTEFRRSEKQFRHYQEAKQWLDQTSTLPI